MAEKILIKNTESGEVQYPVTHESCILTKDGSQLATQKDLEEYELPLQAKRAVFDDMFLRAVGTWGSIDHTHMEKGKPYPYYLNKIWMTYEEAIDVVNAGAPSTIYLEWRYAHSKIRTHLPFTSSIPTSGTTTVRLKAVMFMYLSNIEVINVTQPTGSYYFTPDYFKNCGCSGAKIFSGRYLKEIIGRINASYLEETSNNRLFGDCPLLEEVQVYKLTYNLDITSLPKISANSLNYMLTNAINKDVITITLHPDVYAKITAEEGDYAGIMDLAESKNVSLASA